MIFSQSESRTKRAQGFTLVEILVVFAIIAILAALTATAVFKVIGVMQGNATQSTIKTVSSALDNQWATVIKDHRNDIIPNSVQAIADYDPARARVIWILLNLKKEFPMNLSEALYPWALPTTIPNPPISASDLPRKIAYDGAIKRALQISGASINASTDSSVWPFESAFTLVMALQVNRGGNAFAEENFAANAMASEIFTWQMGPPPQRAVDPFLVGPKMLVDAWGTPLVLYRWPVSNTDFQSTAATSPLSSSLRSTKFPDPIDPQGTLLDPRWNNFNNWSKGQGVWWFEKYLYSIHTGNDLPHYAPYASYLEPVIVSAGPDHGLGVAASSSPALPDEMSVDPLTNTAFADNIVSYKLRTGSTGDK